MEERRASLHVATNSFGGQLKQAAERYTDVDTAPVSPPSKVESTSKRDLIEEVMASREQVRRGSVCALEGEQTIRKAKRKRRQSKVKAKRKQCKAKAEAKQKQSEQSKDETMPKRRQSEQKAREKTFSVILGVSLE